MARPDLIRSWASDALGLFAPDYVWHKRAQVWQQEGPGEVSVKEVFGGSLQQRFEIVASFGMQGPIAERWRPAWTTPWVKPNCHSSALRFSR